MKSVGVIAARLNELLLQWLELPSVRGLIMSLAPYMCSELIHFPNASVMSDGPNSFLSNESLCSQLLSGDGIKSRTESVGLYCVVKIALLELVGVSIRQRSGTAPVSPVYDSPVQWTARLCTITEYYSSVCLTTQRGGQSEWMSCYWLITLRSR